MNIDLQSIKLALKHKNLYPVIFLVIMIVGLLTGLFFIGSNLYQKYEALEAEKTEVSLLRSRVVLVRNNKELLEDRITQYNELLATLIPDEESYFSVITALEALASKTGVTITSYTIDLKSTTEEKLTLNMTVDGSQDALNKLIADYMYISGRLITNEEATIIVDEGKQNFTISFNFFHKEVPNTNTPVVTVVTEKDLEYLDEVMTKMQ